MSIERTLEHGAEGPERRQAGETHSQDSGRGDDAALREGPFVLLYQHSLGNVEAVLKAGDILARGLKMMNTAVVGSTCMAIDDAIADARTALSCRSVDQLVEVEKEAAQTSFRRCLCRASVLCRMATQLMQDVLFPLERRVVLAFELLGRQAH